MFCLLPPPDVGSITLFAVITIILGCLKIGYFVGYSACLSATEGVFPVAHAVHTLVQVNRTMFLYVALVSAKCSSGCAEWRLWGEPHAGSLSPSLGLHPADASVYNGTLCPSGTLCRNGRRQTL